jgi:excisionase family DNA binding protein
VTNDNHATDIRRLGSPAELAEARGVSMTTVRRWIKDGRVQAYRMGPRLIRVDLDDTSELMRPLNRRSA